VKLIIEEGDFGGMAPGVYEVEVDIDEISMLGDCAQSLSFCGTMDVLQTPKPRYWFNADQQTTLVMPPRRVGKTLAAMTLPPVQTNEIYLQAGPKVVHLQVGDVIEDTITTVTWTITAFNLAANTWSCTVNNGIQNEYTCDLDLLAADFESGRKTVRSFQNSSTSLDCDKTATDCRRHKNIHKFGGYTNPNTGRVAKCHHTFGGKACGVGWPKTKEQEALFNETPYGCAANLQPPAMPEDYGVDHAQANTDCPECFGTGLYKGFGGPCSRECPIKGA
jgi:hypothetical protein